MRRLLIAGLVAVAAIALTGRPASAQEPPPPTTAPPPVGTSEQESGVIGGGGQGGEVNASTAVFEESIENIGAAPTGSARPDR